MNTTSQLKYLNISTLTQGMKNNSNIIKFTQLFISLSLFCFILTPSSLFVFLHYLKFYFSTLPFQLYTHNIDKNSMFLLCNGLLVFVGLTKSFSSPSSDTDDYKPSNNTEVSSSSSSSQYVEEDEEGAQSHILDVEAKEPMLDREGEKRTSEPEEQNAEEEEEKVEEENIEKIILIDEEHEEVKELEEDEEEDEGSEIDYILSEENNIEEEEEEESCMLSTEELNKKFEDFIRKMKEDLRMDARRHLVMV